MLHFSWLHRARALLPYHIHFLQHMSSSLRRRSVIVEREDQLSAPLPSAQKILRETLLRMNRLGHSWSGKEREEILSDCQAKIRKNWFQAYHNRRRSIPRLSETIGLQIKKIHRAHQDERRRRDHRLLMNSSSSKIGLVFRVLSPLFRGTRKIINALMRW